MHAFVRIAGPIVAVGVVVATITAGASAAEASRLTSGSSIELSVRAATVGAGVSSLGTVLVGPTKLTLYTHAGDTATTSTCTGGCATAWPPLTITAGQQPTAGPGVTGTLGTLARSDGSTQVSYNGHPLYYWEGDSKPGDATGQGIGGFSVARVAPTQKPKTTITGSIRAGTSRMGPFLTGQTLTIANGHAATVRFHLGKAFVGRSVTIEVATRSASGAWSAYTRLSVRHVESDGNAYAFVTIKGWERFRASYAGDATHGTGLSSPVTAHGH